MQRVCVRSGGLGGAEAGRDLTKHVEGPLSPEINLYKNMNNKSKNKYCLERLDEKIINLLWHKQLDIGTEVAKSKGSGSLFRNDVDSLIMDAAKVFF